MEAGDYLISGTNRLGKEFTYIYYCGTSWDLAILLSKEKYAGSTNVTHEIQKERPPTALICKAAKGQGKSLAPTVSQV